MTDTPVNDNIVDFPGPTICDIPVTKILTEASKKEDLEDVIVIGRQTNGDLYFASTTGDLPYLNWLTDKFKYELLAGDDGTF